MGTGEGFSVISAGDPPRYRNVLQIFQQAARLFRWSWKLMLSISLILLFPRALVFLGSNLIVAPLSDMTDKFITISTKDPRSPEYHELLAATMKGLRELTGAEVAMMLISFLSSSFLLMATVHTVAMAKKREQATLKGLLCRIKRTWKGPVATQLYVAVIYFGCTALLILLSGALVLISNGSLAALVVLGATVAILALLLFVYLQMVWYQGLVISVVEEGCYGLAALGRASELIRGRRKLGFSINLILLLITTLYSAAYYFVNTHLPPGETTHLVGGLVAIYAGSLLSAFHLAVYVVFYNECKKSHGEEVAVKGCLVYTRVPTAPILDGALP